ncbi:MAG: type III pantothenate kinase [Eggerthellaceae bacterium]|nr:type III pantothenate kinase [Eggerthellaceae bacterium]
MLLVVDIGNTQTVVGVYAGEQLLSSWRIGTNRLNTSDELRAIVTPLMQAAGIYPDKVHRAAIASVVPQLTGAWQQAVRDVNNIEMLCCNAETAGELFVADYPHPHEIGSDRIADAVAAKARYGAPVVVVDFGTATNFEVIDLNGRFIGGIIAPGLQTSAAALTSHGALLPAIGLAAPAQAIGTNTVEAIQSGVMLGEADRVDGLVRRIFDQLGYTAPVVATGGLAKTMAPLCKTITNVDTDLTLEGLRLICG